MESKRHKYIYRESESSIDGFTITVINQGSSGLLPLLPLRDVRVLYFKL